MLGESWALTHFYCYRCCQDEQVDDDLLTENENDRRRLEGR
jgi:hypothetical protein